MRHVALLSLLTALAAPAAADAQTRTAATSAATPQMTARTATTERAKPRTPRRTVDLGQPERARLVGREADEVPNVEIQAKDEWFDDEGLQWKGSKVAFKRRF